MIGTFIMMSARVAVASHWPLGTRIRVKARRALGFHLDRLRERGCEIPDGVLS